ncbi:MAG TPA: FAD-dependent monooxygenase [Casimicrobiaceae bacterium]|nr:FAD-dependent monooxygenase [Casimicrobiaceae bacterium]
MLHDLAIVGAGPVGATLALAVAPADLDVVVLDARAAGESLRGDRSLALSHGARLILERLGAWSTLAADRGAVTPITAIDISQAGGFGLARLEAADSDLPALGYVVRYRALQAALDAALGRAGVEVRHGVAVKSVGGTPAYAAVDVDGGDTVLSRLAAVADGTGAAVAGLARHRHDYRQVAIVAQVACASPHEGLAFERFTPDGPVALLPEGDRYGLVWTTTPKRAEELLALPERAFLERLSAHLAARAVRPERVEGRRAFPLVLEFARTTVGPRSVVLGNAAQTLHPVAGQGFNVGLRDAFELARAIVDAPRESIGDRAMLERYARGRWSDRWAGIAFTHGLVNLFGNDRALLRWPRGLALTLLDAVPPAKRAFTRAMLFGLR